MKRILTILLSFALAASISFAALASSQAESASQDSSSASSGEAADAQGGAEPVDAAVDGTGSSLTPSFAGELRATSIYMMNLDSEQPVYTLNAEQRMNPASLTKVMTCIIALESDRDIRTESTPLKAYIQNELYTMRIDTLGGIALGEELTIYDLLNAMMLQSANEAAMMVADYIGDGNMELFYDMMNQKARELGAKNTNFSNATGLYDENNYTTASDMALIVKYAMENEEFREIVTRNTYTSAPTNRHAEGITWIGINLGQKQSEPDYYYEGLAGVKTGSLPGSSVGGNGIHNLATTATRDGYTYLLIQLGADLTDAEGNRLRPVSNFIDAKRLYDWAFENFKVETLMNVGQEVTQINVKLAKNKDQQVIKLVALDKFASLVPVNTTEASVKAEADLPAFVKAPISKGAKIGEAKLILNGEEIGRIDLVAAEAVEASKILTAFDKIGGFFSSFIFKFVFIFLIVVILLYVALMVVRNHNKRRYSSRRKRPRR